MSTFQGLISGLDNVAKLFAFIAACISCLVRLRCNNFAGFLDLSKHNVIITDGKTYENKTKVIIIEANDPLRPVKRRKQLIELIHTFIHFYITDLLPPKKTHFEKIPFQSLTYSFP